MENYSIYRLEQWHRAWEIGNPDKILQPSFASELDMTHTHAWAPLVTRTGTELKRCRVCPFVTKA